MARLTDADVDVWAAASYAFPMHAELRSLAREVKASRELLRRCLRDLESRPVAALGLALADDLKRHLGEE